MRVFRRDAQRARVYAWERIAYPGFITARKLTSPDAQVLVYRVHADIIARGGYAPNYPPISIKFTKRRGGACASWRQMNFTRGAITLDLVLHELAHTLTWCPWERVSAFHRVDDARYAGVPEAISPLQRHLLEHGCDQGHGPKFVACFIALMERYGDRPASAALAVARSFEMSAWGPWTGPRGQRMTRAEASWAGACRTRVKKRASVQVCTTSLAYWRNLLRAPAHTA